MEISESDDDTIADEHVSFTTFTPLTNWTLNALKVGYRILDLPLRNAEFLLEK
ncbi:unnamed protein product, partial [Ceratitis capitata]